MKKKIMGMMLAVSLAAVCMAGCSSTSANVQTASSDSEDAEAVEEDAQEDADADENYRSAAFELVVNAKNEEKTVETLDEELGDVVAVSRDYKIGCVVKSLEGSHWQEVARGYEEMAEELGIEVDIQGGVTEDDMTGQLAIAEAMIEKEYDALILSPITESNLDPAIEKAITKEIPIINVDFEIINTEYPYIHVVGMEDFTPEGQWVAEYFAEQLPEGSQVAHIEGLGGAVAANQRRDGFVGTVEEMGVLEMVSSQPGNWDRETAYNLTANLITQYPELKGIYCANDGMALGCVEAVENSGKDIMVFGTDGIPEAVSSIKEGKMTGTVSAFGYYMGREGIKAAVRLLEGQELPQKAITEVSILTEDNVYDYYPE